MEDLFWIGPKNVIRWIPVIWLDADYDYSDILHILHVKFDRLAKYIEKYGHHLHKDKTIKELKVASFLCKRILNDDVYFKNANARYPKRGRHWAKFIDVLEEQDIELLTSLMKRKMKTWWD